MAKDKTPSDVSKMIKDGNVKLIDFKFTDLLGTWQHFTTTLTEYNEEIFADGLGFDGSSIRGWRVINASDMLVIPDATTAWIDVFNAEPTLSLICTIVDPITRQPYDRDPRGVAEKAESYLKSTGIADTAFIGPEAEFFIFDDVRFANSANASSYIVDSVEGHWNSAREEFPNLGTRFEPRKVISRSRRWIRCKTFATKCVWSWRKRAWRSSGSITKSRPPARPRSISGSPRSNAWATTCNITNISCATSPSATTERSRSCRNQSSGTTAAACTRTSRFGTAINRSLLERLRRAVGAGAVFHRRNLKTRTCAHLPDESNNQQLQAARSRI